MYTPENQDLNPNDPSVYTNPDKVRLLDPREQMIATINLAKTGQLVGGDQVRTLEAILAGAGYNMTLDGQLSAEEQAAIKHFKEKLEDKQFKETAKDLLATIAGAAAMDALINGAQQDQNTPAANAIQTLAGWISKPALAPAL